MTPSIVSSLLSLESVSNDDWSSLIEAVNCAQMLVVIRSRMGEKLIQAVDPEDIWQETLFTAWRDRATFSGRTFRSFRSWLLAIAQNRILGAVDHHDAQKRRIDHHAVQLGGATDSADSHSGMFMEPSGTTTPERLALARERARLMESALDSLDPDLKDIVRLRLFEDLTMVDVARTLGIGESAAYRRLTRGIESYLRALRQVVSSFRSYDIR